MAYSHRSGLQTLTFPDLRKLLARASTERSGDHLAGIAAQSAAERMAARMALADVPLRRFLDEPLIEPQQDEVSRLIFERMMRKPSARWRI